MYTLHISICVKNVFFGLNFMTLFECHFWKVVNLEFPDLFWLVHTRLHHWVSLSWSNRHALSSHHMKYFLVLEDKIVQWNGPFYLTGQNDNLSDGVVTRLWNAKDEIIEGTLHWTKALAKWTRKLTQVCKTRTCVQTCEGWPNGFASWRKSTQVCKTRTCEGWPNGNSRRNSSYTCTIFWRSMTCVKSNGHVRFPTNLGVFKLLVPFHFMTRIQVHLGS